jgi:hypothetical protein
LLLGFLLGRIAAVSLSAETVEFSRDIRPILSDACFQCHGPDEKHREADLRFDDPQSVLEDRGDYAAVVPGARERSELWRRINSSDPDQRMPPPASPRRLSPVQIERLGKWIDEGAKFQGHWAFVPPVRPALPKVEDARFNRQPIDRFVYAVMRDKQLSPSPEAAREILLRRASLDLTGFPPTPEEVEAFVHDSSPDAYDRAVDRLFESPHFGERMALDWMDAARYGDTSVFHADGPRDMWVWRDWVIEAFNANMPFDQFTVEQLAGDLLPDATWRQRVATGFNRNNATTDEGGLIEEEYRVEYVVDRVKTTSMVWLGLSMECGQCHDHKYDPISQVDYYRFFAFFNQAADPGSQTRNGNQTPVVEVPHEKHLAKIPELEARLGRLQSELNAIRDGSRGEFSQWLAGHSQAAKPAEVPQDAVAHFTLDSLTALGEAGQGLPNRAHESEFAVLHTDPDRRPIVEGYDVDALAVGASTFASAADLADFERDQSFSYGCWVKAARFEGAPLARMDTANGYRGFDLHLRPDALEAHFSHAWPGNAIKVEGKAELEPDRWHHVMVTYDGSSKAAGVQLFVDGKKLRVTAPVDKLSDTIRTDKPFTIGRRTTTELFTGQVDDVRVFERVLSGEEVRQLATVDSINSLLLLPEASRTAAHLERLREHYLMADHQAYGATMRERIATEARIADYRKPLSTVMVMNDLPEMRMTYLLNRGQYDQPDKDRPVQPGVPAFLPQLAETRTANRLDMARWIVSRDNPLTARVIVNRYWRLVMGAGIVKTVEEFGSQGEWPSHPQLLDWLAVDFMENGWDVKRLLKQIVTSETYRQSSKSTPAQLRIDPENRYLSRGPRFRLQGEFVRDQALLASGLLTDTVGGPSVKPYQPPGIWNEVSLDGSLRFQQDSGDKLYRRSIYTYWKRSAPAPSMTIFDAPSREKCTVRRSSTNTPLQALVVMNDPQFVEAARFLAQRVMREADSPEARIERAYRLVTARAPSRETMAVLRQAFATEFAALQQSPARAEKLLAIGDTKRDGSLDAVEHAAWTIVASIILNLDETVTRG